MKESRRGSRATSCCPAATRRPALAGLLPEVPAGFRVIVVDNGSSDGTAEVARRLGATVVTEARPGYGAAVHAGLLAATADLVAFMDGDGSFDPAQLLPLVDDVRSGRADLAVGRRRPTGRGTWPWHARAGNALIVAWLRRRIGLPAHDIAPMRVCRTAPTCWRSTCRTAGSATRSSCCRRRPRAGWRFHERDVAYRPRAEGTRSKVSGSVRGTMRTARDFARVLS